MNIFGRFNIKTKMLISFLLLLLISTITIGIVAYQTSYSVVYNQAAISGVEITDRAFSELDAVFKDIDNLFQITQDTISIQNIMRTKFISREERYSKDLEISSQLYVISKFRPIIYGVFIIGENGGVYKSNNRTFYNLDLTETDWYNKIISAKGLTSFSPHEYSLATISTSEKVISFGLPFVDKATGNNIGVILIEIEEEVLKKIVTSLSDLGTTVLFDDNGNVILSPDNATIDYNNMQKLYKDTSTEKQVNSDNISNGLNVWQGKSYVIINKYIEWCGWELASFISTDYYKQQSYAIGLAILISLLIVGLFAFFIIYLISSSITNPIKQLINLMNQAENGDLSVKMEIYGRDEVSKLGNGFNIMINKISNLIEEKNSEQIKLRKMEFSALQAQIAPHFLYNTLDSIVWLARSKKYSLIISITQALAQMFRSGISRGNDIIPLIDEIEHVKSYLIIQNIRYKDKIRFVINIPEALYDYSIIKLVLQPLVENSIYHGIKNNESMGIIDISGTEYDNYIIISVTDNGIGIQENKLNEINISLINNAPSKSYGLKSVNERIKIYFGKDYGISIISKYNEGTTIYIKLPKIC